jgi:hypothetical protein
MKLQPVEHTPEPRYPAHRMSRIGDTIRRAAAVASAVTALSLAGLTWAEEAIPRGSAPAPTPPIRMSGDIAPVSYKPPPPPNYVAPPTPAPNPDKPPVHRLPGRPPAPHP